MTASLPLMKSVLTRFAKSVSILLGLSAGILAIDAGIQIYGSGTTTLIISNEEMEDITKRFKSLKETGLIIKKISVKK